MEVAIALPVSWKPLVKSKASAVATTIASRMGSVTRSILRHRGHSCSPNCYPIPETCVARHSSPLLPAVAVHSRQGVVGATRPLTLGNDPVDALGLLLMGAPEAHRRGPCRPRAEGECLRHIHDRVGRFADRSAIAIDAIATARSAEQEEERHS